MELTVVTDHRGYVEDLVDCYRTHDWWANRTSDDVERAVANSDVFVGLVDSTDRLVAAARVLTDAIYYGKIYDVIVHEDVRDETVGQRLLEEVTDHPDLRDLDVLYLSCEEELVDFYEDCGFEKQEAASEMVTMQYDG
jgi:predicted GNAT family N-acyltransferase